MRKDRQRQRRSKSIHQRQETGQARRQTNMDGVVERKMIGGRQINLEMAGNAGWGWGSQEEF